MKSKVLALCAVIILAGCLLLFTGCQPNYHTGGGVVGGTTAIQTTPRPPAHTTRATTPAASPYYGNYGRSAVEGNSTAFSFKDVELSAGNKVGWGLGSAVDSKNRPIDALSAQSKYGELGAVFINENTGNRIYLTFDEGYENGHTPQILDALGAKGVRATFFVTYDYCKNQPELIQRMINEGHEVGNHSWSHPSFPDCNGDRVREEIMKLHDYVKEGFGYEMRLIRFPMGEFSGPVLTIAHELGYKSVFWSFAYSDWEVGNQPSPEYAYQKIASATHPGAVILLHAVSATNAEILPELLRFWLGNGLKPDLLP